MTTAISISDTNDTKISVHFVRCKQFLLINKTLNTSKLVPNPYFNDKENAGVNAVKYLAAQGVNTIIAGDFGVHVQDETHLHNIQLVIVDPEKTDIKTLL